MIVGRDRELGAIEAALDAATGGSEGALLLLVGEAGIGKTALAREASSRAVARGFSALSARGFEGGGAPSYWLFIQIFRAMLRDSDSSLSPEQGAMIAELVPEIAKRTDPPTTTTRFALFDAAAGWIRRVAEKKPLVLVFDDLHAVDPSSLSMLHFVAHELRDARVVILACHRPREARGIETEAELARLVREATLLELPRLERDAVLQLVSSVKGDVPTVIADLVFRTSEGVPLFVEEVVRSMATPGTALLSGAPLPAGVRTVIHDRLKRLDESTFRLLSVAAVVGRRFTLALVSATVPDVDAHDLVERAVAADVVERVAPGRYAFAHAMIREALYRDLAGGLRAKLHAAITDAFDANVGGEFTPLEHAHHALRAAPVIGVKRATASAHAAAEAAMKVHAFEDAADVLRRAISVLDLAPDGEPLRAGLVAALEKIRANGGTKEPEGSAALTLVLEGELFTARLGKSIVRLKDSRGLRMLARLVERPGEEIHALDLISNAPSEVVSGDSGEMLDREAIGAYRARLLEVEEDIREAEAWNDAARLERARSEGEFLRAELARAVGLGGRSRRAGADAERARVNCQRRIRDAVQRIAQQDADLGRHLLAAVRTGTFCAYVP